MIYMDNSATTLQRPAAVARAMAEAMNMGNPGRSCHGPAMDAARSIYAARQQLARLAGVGDPLRVAFTSGATESLNLLLGGLIRRGEGVITSVLEHNSVLRPLYRLGCSLSLIGCDDRGRLLLEELPALLRPETRHVVCTQGSNLLGSLADVAALSAFCRQHGLNLVLDASQTLGRLPMGTSPAGAAQAGGAMPSTKPLTTPAVDALCFSGHKQLFGPMGTGGIVMYTDMQVHNVKAGGSGSATFQREHPDSLPDRFEAGTPNVPGIAGLAAGAGFICDTGLDEIQRQERELTAQFLEGLKGIPGLVLYGSPGGERLPVIALNLGDMGSDEVSALLWERWEIATRPGFHCAPLAHERFGTAKRGMVRFSLSYFNTAQEIDATLAALATLARS